MRNFEPIKECIACGNQELRKVLDLGTQPLANSFKDDPHKFEEYYPLMINRCTNCYHVQLSHRVHPDLLFKNYLYVSGTSQTQLDYFKWFRKMTVGPNDKTVLDVGCNDGSQLNEYKAFGLDTYGVDPAKNLYEISSENHKVICDYFNETTFDEGTKFDIIVCQNAFAHNYNPLQFLKLAKKVMHKDSNLYITTSQANMILNGEFDTIYHEHISYYNIKSMNELCNRAGLNLVDVKSHSIHGGSYIFVINLENKDEKNIKRLIAHEKKIGLYSAATYGKYTKKCKGIIKDLKIEMKKIQKLHIPIIGFGAAAKGNTLLNATGIKLDFIIDENPLKKNKFTPGSNIEIFGLEYLDLYGSFDKICFVPLAWNFYDEIKKKIKLKRPDNKDIFVRYFPEILVEDN